MTKIAFLVPSSSKNRNWESFTDTYIHKHLLSSARKTKDDDFQYCFYLGFDPNDRIYSSEMFMENIKMEYGGEFLINITVFEYGIEPGHLTKMWNKLFSKAYEDGCDYFFQCGDDVELLDVGWCSACVNSIKSNNNMGMVGPIDVDYPRILTQTMVSRKHMKVFGYYFPEEIKNWYCDDWINEVYRLTNLAYKPEGRCVNRGGSQRYDIVRVVPNFKELVKRGVESINLNQELL